jgi:hypothetical protein
MAVLLRSRPLSSQFNILIYIYRFAWKGRQKKWAFRHAWVTNIDQAGTGGSGVM